MRCLGIYQNFPLFLAVYDFYKNQTFSKKAQAMILSGIWGSSWFQSTVFYTIHYSNYYIDNTTKFSLKIINTWWHESLPMLRSIVRTSAIVIMVQVLSIEISVIRRKVLWEVLRSVVRLMMSIRHIVTTIHYLLRRLSLAQGDFLEEET